MEVGSLQTAKIILIHVIYLVDMALILQRRVMEQAWLYLMMVLSLL